MNDDFYMNDCFCLIGEETVTPRNDKSGSRLPRLFRESDFESGSVAVGLIPKCGACWKEKPGVPSGLSLVLESISLRTCRALGIHELLIYVWNAIFSKLVPPEGLACY